MKSSISRRLLATIALAVAACVTLSGCAGLSWTADELNRAFQGSDATFRTYDKTGNVMDNISGPSIRVTRDSTFDETTSDSTKKGSVVMVQVGKSEIRHVGSTATLIQEGIDVVVPAQQGIVVESTEEATPFLEKIIAQHQNLWKGSAKTVLVRTQDDVPVAVFSGAEVELFKPDVPNATAIRVTGTDGKTRMALVYRSNLTIYDTALLISK